ncbi:MAG: hypothetical protein QNK03_08480 [Myxococcota bacterium]|nr:hypothetical protein [Myxococcota bacterium]
MRRHTDRALLRRFLTSMLILGLVNWACGDLDEEVEESSPAIYEYSGFVCESEEAAVEAGELFDDIDPIDDQCMGASEVFTAAHIEGQVNPFVTVDFNTEQAFFETVITCAYDLEADLPDPEVATCSATVSHPFEFFFVFGEDPITLTFRARALALGAEPATSFTGSASVQCPNDPLALVLPLDGTAVTTMALPLMNGSCDVDIHIDSEATTGGTSYHSISLLAVDPTIFCQTAGACGGATPLCGPSGCQAGSEGDPCLTAHIPSTTTGDCAASSPFCVNGACQDGSTGDPCNGDYDCAAGLVCPGGATPFCSLPGP